MFAPAFAEAEVRFDFPAVVRKAARALEVDVRLRNDGASEVRSLFVEGELAGRRAEAELPMLAGGALHVFTLRFPRYLPRPGRYALTLLAEYRIDKPPDAPPHNQRAFLLLDLGARPQPALGVRIEPLTLDVAGSASVVLESVDGAAHRAGLRILLPAGVNVLEAPAEVDVPAGGRVSVEVRLIRGAAPRGQAHGIIAVAGPVDGPLERASVAVGEIRIAPDPAWLPRLRPVLVALGALLLLAAAASELRGRRALRP